MTVGFVSIVGNELRHRWLVSQLAADERLNLRGVVCEQKRARPTGASAEENATIRAHFARRIDAEQRFFGATPDFEELGVPVLRVAHGGSNQQHVAEWVDEREPDRLQLFGCGIIRQPLLDTYKDATINIHLGLSPYYRGAATNFWPLVNGEPECVGATIHVATLKVDAGPILKQRRPEIAIDDGAHDIGCRAIIAGSAALSDAITRHAAGELAGERQQPGGRLYKNADFNAAAVEEMSRRMGDGMIRDYLAARVERDAVFPIVE